MMHNPLRRGRSTPVFAIIVRSCPNQAHSDLSQQFDSLLMATIPISIR